MAKNAAIPKTQTRPWDSAKYFADSAAQDVLLADAFGSGDAAYIRQALGTIARAKGLTSVAKEIGLTRVGLTKALSSAGDPKLSTILGVAKALDLRLSMSRESDVARPAKSTRKRPAQKPSETPSSARLRRA